MRRVWIEQIQPPLAKLSPRSRHVIVDCGHMIPIAAPAAVVKAIDDLIEMQQVKPPPPPALSPK
jgi:pimeloyl-ACP methyl ester carboxylesterase